MVWQQTLLVCCLFGCWSWIVPQVVCSGVFELRIKSFVNEQGKDSLGQCCSGEQVGDRCLGQCRTRFRICLKHFQNQIDASSMCTFGDLTSPVVGGNNVTGDQWPANFNRTIQFHFDFSWPGWFSLIVEAWHDSSTNASEQIFGMTASPFAGINIGGRRLISRFPMHQWLDVKPQWSEKADKDKSEKIRMLYEFRVTCFENYYGAGCANLCRSRDDSFGHYRCSEIGEILCLQGWKGDYCTQPVCSSGCNETHGSCTKPGECTCHSGWRGATCNECERYPGCAQGRCEKPWDCICNEGWGGLFCNQDLNYCTNHRPCRNGGTCFNTGQGAYTCSCPPGYTGTDCDQKLSNCSHKPCLNGATCKEKNGTSYQCQCQKGWYGEHCEIAVKTCEGKPCQHGGTCMDSIHGYKCTCPPGYGGNECQSSVNHCQPNPCANGGNCSLVSNSQSGFKCSCPNGFTGPRCLTNLDDCRGNPCLNGGTCVDLVNAYTCKCVVGWVGVDCGNRMNYCHTMPCANGGTCTNLIHDFSCTCPPSFTGKDCSHHLNRCASNPCQHGGTCYHGAGSTQCDCRPGYKGQFCEEDETSVLGQNSRHVAVARPDDILPERLMEVNWFPIIVAAVAIPTIVIIAVLYVMRLKQRHEREKEKADEEARMQNEQNSIHSSCVTMRGDTHMIKNTWGQCVASVKEVDVPDGGAADFSSYPAKHHHQMSYGVVPADMNLAPMTWDTMQRSRSQKQLNIDPMPLYRHSAYNRVSCKDLDKLVNRTTTNSLVTTPRDNRLSLISVNLSHSNLR